jgi:hypothetical protein
MLHDYGSCHSTNYDFFTCKRGQLIQYSRHITEAIERSTLAKHTYGTHRKQNHQQICI